jgi:hypothetical protein
MPTVPPEDHTKTGLPPFVKTWRQLYLLVLLNLVLLIAGLWAFTLYFG